MSDAKIRALWDHFAVPNIWYESTEQREISGYNTLICCSKSSPNYIGAVTELQILDSEDRCIIRIQRTCGFSKDYFDAKVYDDAVYDRIMMRVMLNA